MDFNTEPQTLETTVKIEKIIYPKGTMGECWGIVNLKDMENKITVPFSSVPHDFYFSAKGQLPELDLGATYKFVGKLVHDQKYGNSYEIVYMGINLSMNNETECQNFLSAILSDAQVEKMVEHFGDYSQILDCIKKEDKNLLQEVKGIGEHTADIILNKYYENKQYENAFKELAQFNIPNNLLKKILNAYSTIHEAVNIIKTNPYALAGKIKGIAFATTDSIGKKIGIPEDSPKRIGGYLLWYFEDLAQNQGHSWSEMKDVIKDVISQLNLSYGYESIIRQCIEVLKKQNHLSHVESIDAIGSSKYFKTESAIANELVRLITTRDDLEYDSLDEGLLNIKNTLGFELTDEQVEGTKTILDSSICIITGSAGSGKTFSSKLALSLLQPHNSIACCALSGKAASRIKEATGFEGQTIHRLLQVGEDGKFLFDEANKLYEKIILIDEASMVNGTLFLSLLQAIPDGSKLILLGDINQLEAIGFGCILRDMIESGVIPTVQLTKIHRQAAKSGIITQGRNINDGIQITHTDNIQPQIQQYGELKDLSVVRFMDYNKTQLVTKLFQKEYSKYNNISHIQGLCPVKNNGELCCFALNQEIQKWYHNDILMLNPNNTHIEMTRNKTLVKMYVGDKVINMANNYKVETPEGMRTSIFNGYVGIITYISSDAKSMIVDFGDLGGKVVIEKGNFIYIELAYFITVHKYQGSQALSVVLTFDTGAYKLLNRQMVYTGITRAQKNCIMVVQNKALQMAIRTNHTSNKRTYLKTFIQLCMHKHKKQLEKGGEQTSV